MRSNRGVTRVLSASALWFTACATGGEVAPDRDGRDGALERLQRTAGAPVTLEINEAGTARVLAMTPWFAVAGHATDPAAAAQRFLADHHDVFQLSAQDAASFVVTRVDVEPQSDLRHITLQRSYHGIPVFQGAITVHMDPGNGVFRALGDEAYRISAPTNRQILTPAEAAVAAGKALGLSALAPALGSSEGLRTTFTTRRTIDPIAVEPRIFQVAPDDHRFAYQATVSWLDDQRQPQSELALVDAQDGSLLYRSSLVNTFSGLVFTASPGASPVFDTRTLVSFNGNPTASPSGWVDATTKTRGNNVIAATDLNHDDMIGPGEVQPTANGLGVFDFPFDPLVDASMFREAAVTSAFFLVNDFHDRTYALGFTEASGNFQTSNFGRGGLGNDEVQIDVQDGGGSNNAVFTSAPEGSRPRITLFRFTLSGGPSEDSAFDPSVIYHENTHGLVNRVVGAGTPGCLAGVQSGGMGEGWGDFMAASFLNDPVIGAYVSGNATVGVRTASMASSPFTYGNIQDGTMTEVHGGGEVWAAALWAVRTALGAAVTNQLVVQGMKLTPCSPTMLQARDGIISADAILNGGANRCALFTAFASRLMGSGASSPNHNSTSTIVTSPSVPATCGGVSTIRTFQSTDVPKAIPDNSAAGVNSVLTVPAGLNLQQVRVDVNITHPTRGNLVIQVVSPGGATATLSNLSGGTADNFAAAGQDISRSFVIGGSAAGTWKLFVRDLVAGDVGTINTFRLTLTSTP
jgi:fungalysin metallopeptidase (M36)/proprotein convertase P-domain-containing protein/fungalysin/thermolysin propeptide